MTFDSLNNIILCHTFHKDVAIITLKIFSSAQNSNPYRTRVIMGKTSALRFLDF